MIIIPFALAFGAMNLLFAWGIPKYAVKRYLEGYANGYTAGYEDGLSAGLDVLQTKIDEAIETGRLAIPED